MSDSVGDFIESACVPRQEAHVSGTLERANAILSAEPGMAERSVYTAAVLGDDAHVGRFLEVDPGNATKAGGPREWDALTYLCFSRYLRLDSSRSEGFVRAARLLLEAGADANSGWFEKNPGCPPVWESALYGAAGIAHHAGVTQALIDHGADPNDGEVYYHTPESYDNEALKIVVGSGRCTADTLASMLLRKTDWHDYEGVKWLLENGADPNRFTPWGKTALHNAAMRDNALRIFEILLDHGADPSLVSERSPSWHQAERGSLTAALGRRGRGDVLALFRELGLPVELEGAEKLIAACAMNDSDQIQSVIAEEKKVGGELTKNGGKLLAEFAGNGNVEGMRHLLDLGVSVDALYVEGDGYFEIAPRSTALHVAAWRAQHEAVRLLIGNGAPIETVDGAGRTAMMLAVKACTDSYWSDRRKPDSIAALLAAGASIERIGLPTGYPEADALLMKTHNRPSS